MSKYRKLVAALMGVGAMTAVEFFGVDPSATAEGVGYANTLTDALIGLGTLIGVWAVPNAR